MEPAGSCCFSGSGAFLPLPFDATFRASSLLTRPAFLCLRPCRNASDVLWSRLMARKKIMNTALRPAPINASIGQEYCHRCGYCLPCSQGIHIFSQIDLFKTSTITMEQKRALYKQMKEKGAKTAGDCVACGECIEKCPFKLPIPDILERADKALSE